MSHCEPPFWQDPKRFLNSFSLVYMPGCGNQIWNFTIRLLILAIIVGMIGYPFCGNISIGISVLMAIVIWSITIMTTHREWYPAHVVTTEETQLTPTVSAYLSRDALINREAAKEGKYEGFVNPIPVGNGEISRIVGVEATLPNVDVSPYSGPALPEYMPPSARNPFMNILIDEYKYNPQRPAAADSSNPNVKQTLDDYFRVQWFSDPTDVFGKNQDQRQFITQPSTSIPNDCESYQNWLYKIPGKTCKEGGRTACLAGTDGGPITWLNMDL